MKKEYDLRKLKRRPGKTRVYAESAKIPISIRLEGGTLADLRTEAERLGMPYQTLIGSILHRYANGKLVDPKSLDLEKINRKAP